jgi:hypothetical protein
MTTRPDSANATAAPRIVRLKVASKKPSMSSRDAVAFTAARKALG